MSGFIYLAGPIDQVEDDQVRAELASIRIALKHQLGRAGLGTYDPSRAFTVGEGQQPSREISQINNWALGRCDGLIAYLPPRTPTIGTPMEIERAVHNGIPTVIGGATDSWELAKYQNNPMVLHVEQLVLEALTWLAEAIRVTGGAQGRVQQAMPVAKIRPEQDAILPQRQYSGDAGFDVYVSQDTVVEPGRMVDIPCNIAVELDAGTWGLLVGRSSTLRTKGLQVHTGIIDQGYRGELFAAVSSLGDQPVEVKRGERLAQLIVLPNQSQFYQPVMVGRLAESDRGVAGFGSTGA